MASETQEVVPSAEEAESVEKNELDSLVSDLAYDYSKYLKVNIASEKAALEDEIEETLTQLDEFTSLVDMVRSDNALCLNSTLPEIYKKCEEMEKMFAAVDKMEQMIQLIKQNLDVMEEKMNEAEQQLDSSSVKKLFNTFQKPLFSKKNNEPKKQIKYEPPEIFKTEDFFTSKQQPSSSSEAEKMEASIDSPDLQKY